MKTYLTVAAMALTAIALAADRAAAADAMPSDMRPFTYVISTTNGPAEDAGTTHRVFFSGSTAEGRVTGSFVVPPEPNKMGEAKIGPFALPLQTLYFTLNGSDFRAPDNWKPVRIRITERVKDADAEVVADHPAWDQEFHSDQRTHEMFDRMTSGP